MSSTECRNFSFISSLMLYVVMSFACDPAQNWSAQTLAERALEADIIGYATAVDKFPSTLGPAAYDVLFEYKCSVRVTGNVFVPRFINVTGLGIIPLGCVANTVEIGYSYIVFIGSGDEEAVFQPQNVNVQSALTVVGPDSIFEIAMMCGFSPEDALRGGLDPETGCPVSLLECNLIGEDRPGHFSDPTTDAHTSATDEREEGDRGNAYQSSTRAEMRTDRGLVDERHTGSSRWAASTDEEKVTVGIDGVARDEIALEATEGETNAPSKSSASGVNIKSAFIFSIICSSLTL
ncbi:uncharacterized protein [Ptychodera flava]|uniref:uncharacterized protein n=1 Tax=Ptychodera flava TaxID=63121 RepID=UPI00396A670E